MASPPYTSDASLLPEYKSSVFYQGTLDTKLEYTSPTRRNFNRGWFKASVELNNTQITITPHGFRHGTRKVLTMQYAQVGFAGDYHKGIYPLRLRAQGMQFLFECRELLTSLKWIQAIELSIAISLPIELRVEPPERYQTLHRVRCRRSEIKQPADCEKTSAHIGSECNTLIGSEDIPWNMAFNLRDFGVILDYPETSRQTSRHNWGYGNQNDLPFEMTY